MIFDHEQPLYQEPGLMLAVDRDGADDYARFGCAPSPTARLAGVNAMTTSVVTDQFLSSSFATAQPGSFALGPTASSAVDSSLLSDGMAPELGMNMETTQDDDFGAMTTSVGVVSVSHTGHAQSQVSVTQPQAQTQAAYQKTTSAALPVTQAAAEEGRAHNTRKRKTPSTPSEARPKRGRPVKAKSPAKETTVTTRLNARSKVVTGFRPVPMSNRASAHSPTEEQDDMHEHPNECAFPSATHHEVKIHVQQPAASWPSEHHVVSTAVTSVLSAPTNTKSEETDKDEQDQPRAERKKRGSRVGKRKSKKRAAYDDDDSEYQASEASGDEDFELESVSAADDMSPPRKRARRPAKPSFSISVTKPEGEPSSGLVLTKAEHRAGNAVLQGLKDTVERLFPVSAYSRSRSNTPSDGGAGGPEPENKEDKNLRHKRDRNAKSASKYRAKRKVYVTMVEDKLVEVASENAHLLLQNKVFKDQLDHVLNFCKQQGLVIPPMAANTSRSAAMIAGPEPETTPYTSISSSVASTPEPQSPNSSASSVASTSSASSSDSVSASEAGSASSPTKQAEDKQVPKPAEGDGEDKKSAVESEKPALPRRTSRRLSTSEAKDKRKSKARPQQLLPSRRTLTNTRAHC